MSFASSKKDPRELTGQIVYDRVKLRDLPQFVDLNNEVQAFLSQCSWWDKYGLDWAITGAGFLLAFLGLMLMKTGDTLPFCCGFFLYGWTYQMFGVRCAHASIHNAVSPFKTLNKICCIFFGDFCASFSEDAGYDIHIRVHHPHTNIIGLGDSSTWKVPFLPAMTYMYVAPLLLPLLNVPVSIKELWGQWGKMIKYIFFMTIGIYVNISLLMKISGFSLAGAFLCLITSRSLLAIPYIHVNIFQHIGLAMYSPDSRPKKIYQMSTGVLNLPRNPILDYAFGHSIISAHIEHHLFPHLSDNMCLKIKPIVSHFLKKNGLPYHEDTYFNRMWDFTVRYKELMVNAPPITHFVGIQ